LGYKSYKNDILKALDKAKKDICNDIGTFVIAEAQTRTTVLTGNLRRSEFFEVMDNNEGVNVGVTPDAPYAIFVEKGTSTQHAQPFLEPAVMDNINKLEEIAGQSIKVHMDGD
jgi:HK97 gp10 family phage protein